MSQQTRPTKLLIGGRDLCPNKCCIMLDWIHTTFYKFSIGCDRTCIKRLSRWGLTQWQYLPMFTVQVMKSPETRLNFLSLRTRSVLSICRNNTRSQSIFCLRRCLVFWIMLQGKMIYHLMSWWLTVLRGSWLASWRSYCLSNLKTSTSRLTESYQTSSPSSTISTSKITYPKSNSTWLSTSTTEKKSPKRTRKWLKRQELFIWRRKQLMSQSRKIISIKSVSNSSKEKPMKTWKLTLSACCRLNLSPAL